MARDISIAISAKDNFTDSIKKMQTMQTAFRKDLGQLNTELNKMNNNKVELKVDMSKAKNELKEAEKNFKKLGDEANRNKLIMAQTNYDNVKRNFDLISQGAKQTERDIRNLTDTMSKSDNKMGTMGTSGSGGTIGALAKAGLFNMVGQSASQALGAGASSLLGSSDGNAIASVASGAMAGATIGSIIPGIGTAVGAAVGTLAGGITAMTQKFGEKDDAFKEVVKSNYELAKSIQDNALTNGSTLAGSREQTRISFSTLLGGDGVADNFLNQLTEFSTKTPYQFEQLTTMSKTLLAYGYKMEDIIPLLTKVGDAGSALGLAPDDINWIATSLGRMQTTGKTTLEYLNPIMERGIPVIDMLAKGLGVAKEDVLTMVSDGLIPGAEAAKILADAMGSDYSGNMEKQAQTFEGLTSTLKDMQNAADIAMGEAYNEERKKGLNAQIDWMGGESGAKMQEANAMIGAWKASLDNEHDAAIREAMDAMMATAEYKTAEAEGDKVMMGQLLAEAQVKGENEYKASTGYQEQLASDLELIGKIRSDTALQSEYYNTGLTMAQEFSKGILAGKNIDLSVTTTSNYMKQGMAPNSHAYGLSYVPYDNYPLLAHQGEMILTASEARNYREGAGANVNVTTTSNYMTQGMAPNSHAYGLSYVPYDNYPALLHEGEKVLTASEARGNANSGPVNININGTVVREEADINKIASAIVNQLSNARINYGGVY